MRDLEDICQDMLTSFKRIDSALKKAERDPTMLLFARSIVESVIERMEIDLCYPISNSSKQR